jgi:hypothetical protein
MRLQLGRGGVGMDRDVLKRGNGRPKYVCVSTVCVCLHVCVYAYAHVCVCVCVRTVYAMDLNLLSMTFFRLASTSQQHSTCGECEE